jgi:fatty-acyl-CoA synthase
MTPYPSVDARRAALDNRFPEWTARTTAQFLDATLTEFADRPLVLTRERDYTYRDIAQWSRRLAAGLMALGVQPGDHVAVDMANLPETVALKFAVARVGAVSVSINFLLKHEELDYILRQSDATVLITMDRFRSLDYLRGLDMIAPGWDVGPAGTAGGQTLPALRHIFVHGMAGSTERGRDLRELIELGRDITDAEVMARTAAVDPDSSSDLLYTSGTTGSPKGAMLRHDSVLRTAYSSVYTRALHDGRRMLYALPIYHVFGYVEGLIAVLFVGGAICPHAAFDADETLRDVARHGIDEIVAVPAMTSVLLDQARAGDYDLSSLHVMFSSGSAHAPGMWQDMVQILGVSELFTAYGQTETTASALSVRAGDPRQRLVDTVGTVKLAGAAGDPELDGLLAVYKVVHTETGADLPAGGIGELLVRGPAVTLGYYNKPAETAASFTADGWFRTGDLGRFDEDGYLRLTGRKKESYRCGGELVLPSEVEQVLTGFAGVLAAHVVGIPHRRMGEVGCAFLVVAHDRPDPRDVIAYCASRLARFKVPAEVLFIPADELPTTVTGRVRKFELAERAARELASPDPSPRPVDAESTAAN